MSDETHAYEISSDLSVHASADKITKHELDMLEKSGIVVSSSTNNYQLTDLEIDLQTLQEIAFEYSILKRVASTVEIEIMKYIRMTTNDRITTREVADAVDRPPSTVSRTLGKLVDKGQIKKVQDGLYERY